MTVIIDCLNRSIKQIQNLTLFIFKNGIDGFASLLENNKIGS